MLKQFGLKRLSHSRKTASQFFSSPPLRSDLCGRDILQPNDFTVNEWKTILWTAIDLKQSVMKNNKTSLNILCNKHVTLLFAKTSARNLLSCTVASHLLGAKSTYYADPDFDSQVNSSDIGRALCQITDLFLVNDCNQTVLCQLAEGSSAPVVGLSTNKFSIFKALAFLMTIQERFGHLQRLKLAWIGPASPLCNTILSVFPSFGINIKFCCICAHGTGQITPIGFENALLAGNKGLAEIHQCSTAKEAVYRSHVVIVASHPDEQNRIISEIVEEAELEWILLHALPRTESEISNDVFLYKNNQTWQSSSNQVYIAMAMIVSTLMAYQPKSPAPRFGD